MLQFDLINGICASSLLDYLIIERHLVLGSMSLLLGVQVEMVAGVPRVA
jgi:hypothetical protein